ncbi:hypothetical protein [Ornithinibacillus bavariensis]|uniref:GyrI-like small molecule binding domain-containing protein n=1 Tax=Ornithinibacillus bavariensis TaxID=545502 RepID=A0A920C873_9BACI|nr:hypothetical protein [Ornithinibacillus bavariensis]GIO28378.1 hypothetical protein J43TS3_29890 [Ornithinibacillus bavariensis]
MVNTVKPKTNNHRKLLKQIYEIKEGKTVIETLPDRCYVSQRMCTSFHMDWDGHPEPKDEKWIGFKVVNQIKQITKTEMDYRFKLMPHEMIWLQQEEDQKWLVDRMMLVPDFITEDIYTRALEKVKKNLRVDELPAISFRREAAALEALQLHVGHYRDTKDTLAEMEEEVNRRGYEMILPHREIYLNPAMDCYPAHNCKTVICVKIQKRDE